jgi:hypothetical protein
LAGDIEAELGAIKTLQQTLEPLSPEVRARVLDYVLRVLEIPAPTPAPAQAAQPINLNTTPRPIAPTLVKNLVTLAKAYAKADGVKLTTVGTNSTKTASFYDDLESGETSCTLRKYDLLTKWFSRNWPAHHTMPKLVDPEHFPTQMRNAK